MTSTTLAADTPAEVTCAAVERTDQAGGRQTYGEILKSTALVGVASVVNILAGIVRTKTNALFLGPAGVGLMGLYSSVLALTQSLAGMGIQNSGVRQIAEASGAGDRQAIARTTFAVRRI